MPVTIDGSAGIGTPGMASTGAVSGTTGTFSGNVTANGLSTELRPLVLMTSQASTSGTVIDFTSIPSWAKRITVMLSGVSLDAVANFLIQIGDSGGIENTGYISGATQSNNTVTATSTAGYVLNSGGAAASLHYGSIILTHFGSNKWVAAGVLNIVGIGHTNAGEKVLSDTLTQLRVTSTTGTANFDAGSINVMYE